MKNGIRKRCERFLIPHHKAKAIARMTKSIITKSFKFRISKPAQIVRERLEQTLYHCRFLYNASLQERRDAYKINHISLNYQAQQNQLPAIKVTNPEYKEIHSQVLQNVLKRVERAFDGFFRRLKAKQPAGFPRFKGQDGYDSFCYPQSGFSLTGDKLTLSKIGKVKIKLSRAVVGKVKTCTIKKEIDKWFVIFTVETAIEPLPRTGESVGLDMGISAFLTLSDGTQIDNWKYYESSQKKLRIAQRRLARRKKGSHRRRQAALLLKKTHRKIKRQRNDWQHKISTYLVKNYDLLAIEKLNVLGLSRGILSKQVNDVAWSAFLDKLRYKVANTDKQLIEVAPHFTSQDCSSCGNRVKKDLSVRIHHCLLCNLKIDRDFNAAINILNKAVGHTVKDITWADAPCVSLESTTNLL